jgi:hypothetical protein
MIQVKDYINWDPPYKIMDSHVPIDFWDEWWAVRINTLVSRAKIDKWCLDKWGWSATLAIERVEWFRFAGSDVWLFRNKNDALHFTLKWHS